MAFRLQQIEAVEFGDKKLTPTLDAETKLRLRAIQFGTMAQEESADKVIASCFGADSAWVEDYLKLCPTMAKQRLQTYLLGGEDAVKALDASLVEATKQALRKGGE